jgi:phage-related protein
VVNDIVFDGKGSYEFGVRVEKHPNQNAPKRRRTAITIPGRNGQLHYDEDAYDNISIDYSVWFRGEYPTPEQAHNVKAWLLGGKGYRRLEDKYDPTHFRMASFAGPLTIDNILGRYGRCKITFDCDPRCYLKSGEFPVALENGSFLYNPTEFRAKPLIQVYGNGTGNLRIAGVSVEIHAMTTGLVLDCENEICHALGDALQNLDGDIYAPQFPVLEPGNNRVVFTGDITAVQIIPRWWEL